MLGHSLTNINREKCTMPLIIVRNNTNADVNNGSATNELCHQPKCFACVSIKKHAKHDFHKKKHMEKEKKLLKVKN